MRRLRGQAVLYTLLGDGVVDEDPALPLAIPTSRHQGRLTGLATALRSGPENSVVLIADGLTDVAVA